MVHKIFLPYRTHSGKRQLWSELKMSYVLGIRPFWHRQIDRKSLGLSVCVFVCDIVEFFTLLKVEAKNTSSCASYEIVWQQICAVRKMHKFCNPDVNLATFRSVISAIAARDYG